jgi:hypothetical protein
MGQHVCSFSSSFPMKALIVGQELFYGILPVCMLREKKKERKKFKSMIEM